MSEIAEIVARYYSAAENGDAVEKSNAIRRLDEVELDMSSWQEIREFCTKAGLKAICEVFTRRLITYKRPDSSEPYLFLINLLIQNGRNDEALQIIDLHHSIFGDQPGTRWEVIQALFSTGNFLRCLELIYVGLRSDPENFGYRAMECRSIWGLGQSKLAKSKCVKLGRLLKNNLGEWVWFASISREVGEKNTANATIKSIIKMIENNELKLSSDVLYLLIETGNVDVCQKLIRNIKPHDYTKVDDLVFMFDNAIKFGAYHVAEQLGKHLMHISPSSAIRLKLDNVVRKLEYASMFEHD